MSEHHTPATTTSPVKTLTNSSPMATATSASIEVTSTTTSTLTPTTATTPTISTSEPLPSLVRKRGRPKGPTKSSTPTGRGRGRPAGSAVIKIKSGRGRGRPKSTKTVKNPSTPGRGRGRPRTTPLPITTASHTTSASGLTQTPVSNTPTTSRKPGRPRTKKSTNHVSAQSPSVTTSDNPRDALSSSSPKKRRKYNAPHKIPTISKRQLSGSQWRQEYSKIHAVFVKDVCNVHTNPWTQQPRLKIKNLLERFPDMAKTTFNLEHSRGTNPMSDNSPWPDMVEGQNRAWYASFVVQNDVEAVDEVLAALPTPSLVKSDATDNDLTHLNCAWLFFGENTDNEGVLQGRTEHTDAVTHDGTWHVQLSGTKTWYIRPTDELVRLSETSLSSDVVFEITCGPGDLLLLNTRLWWHRTEIKDTSFANDQLSCSYARDIVFGDAEESCDMTNVDGLFAKDFIVKGTIVLRASDNPDLELPSNDNPTCEVSETDDGEIVLIAARDITKGEWFSVDVEEDGNDDETDVDDDDVTDDDDMQETEDAVDGHNDDDDDDDGD
eukprot:m.109875 g.109875  ORF g.109875 m.109875 type:complete len:550 (+) comp27994_c2_seq1:159-1808(+)